jgi:hypothetical protein
VREDLEGPLDEPLAGEHSLLLAERKGGSFGFGH